MIGKGIGWVFSHLTYIGTGLTAVFTFAVQYIEEVATNHWMILYLQKHPIRISIAAGLLALATPLIRVLFRLIIRGLRQLFYPGTMDKQVDSERPDAEMLVQAVGVSAFYPHSTKAEKKRDWHSCVESIKNHHARDLRIMGATGWNTFGEPKSPLYRLLSQFDGEVKILLMLPDPKLPALIRRAKETGRAPEEYVAEIKRSIERIRVLRAKGKNISLKFYSQTPIWKMIISNDFMWLQHYCATTDVEDTHVYVFFSDGDDGSSLFHPLYSVWLKRWEHDDNKQCRFTETCAEMCVSCGITHATPALA